MSNNRYKAIADYPSSHIPVGDIVHAFTDALDAFYSKYPHLFRLLKWWEHGPVDELPKYVKFPFYGWNGVYKINEWIASKSHKGEYFTILTDGDNECQAWLPACIPSTESEYNDYLNKLNSKKCKTN